MRIEQLMYLIDINQTKSISKTAQNFYITQQGVSDALKKIEKEFSVKLLQRTKYGVLLTPMGEFFVEKGKQMVALHDELKEYVEIFHNSQLASLDGELKIMAHPRIYQHLLPSVIQTFFIHCPNIRLRILESNTLPTLDALREGTVDIGLITTPLGQMTTPDMQTLSQDLKDHLNADALFTDDLIVCVNRESPLSKTALLTEEALSSMPVVTYDFDIVSANNRFQNNSKIFISNDTELHKKLVRQGLAVDVMSKSEYKLIFSDDPNFVAIPFDKNCKIQHILLTNKTLTHTPQMEHFIKLLKKFDYPK